MTTILWLVLIALVFPALVRIFFALTGLMILWIVISIAAHSVPPARSTGESSAPTLHELQNFSAPFPMRRVRFPGKQK